MHNTYMIDVERKTSARAIGKDLPISPKVSIEICNFLRHKELDKAIATLKRVMQKTEPVPFKRFTNALGHKPGMASGRYPIKASGEIVQLLENAKANAANLGLSGTLVISHMAANRANEPYRNGRKSRVTFKRTHVEVIVTEKKTTEKKEKRNETKKETKKAKKAE